MTPVNVNLQQLIQQIDKDLANATHWPRSARHSSGRAPSATSVTSSSITTSRRPGRWAPRGASSARHSGSPSRPPSSADPGRLLPIHRPGRQAIVNAQEQARTLRHDYIGTEHMLLGVLDVEQGAAAQVVADLAGPLATGPAEDHRVAGARRGAVAGQDRVHPAGQAGAGPDAGGGDGARTQLHRHRAPAAGLIRCRAQGGAAAGRPGRDLRHHAGQGHRVAQQPHGHGGRKGC